jgi:hypothetical protein
MKSIKQPVLELWYGMWFAAAAAAAYAADAETLWEHNAPYSTTLSRGIMNVHKMEDNQNFLFHAMQGIKLMPKVIRGEGTKERLNSFLYFWHHLHFDMVPKATLRYLFQLIKAWYLHYINALCLWHHGWCSAVTSCKYCTVINCNLWRAFLMIHFDQKSEYQKYTSFNCFEIHGLEGWTRSQKSGHTKTKGVFY